LYVSTNLDKLSYCIEYQHTF